MLYRSISSTFPRTSRTYTMLYRSTSNIFPRTSWTYTMLYRSMSNFFFSQGHYGRHKDGEHKLTRGQSQSMWGGKEFGVVNL